MAYVSYEKEVKDSVIDYIKDNYTEKEIIKNLRDKDDFYEKLNDDLWVCDSVTGNGSGSFHFSTYKSKVRVLEAIEEEEETIKDMINEFSINCSEHIGDWEFWDVSLRCYVLGVAISEALDELEAEEETGIIYISKTELLNAIREAKERIQRTGQACCGLYFYKTGEITVSIWNDDFVANIDVWNDDVEDDDENTLTNMLPELESYSICL